VLNARLSLGVVWLRHGTLPAGRDRDRVLSASGFRMVRKLQSGHLPELSSTCSNLPRS
jgi:hypothetical protein